MKDKKITLTSKNQITLPAHLVRSMRLNRTRKLRITRRGKSIVLTPLPSLEDSLKSVWAKTNGKRVKPLSDTGIKKATRNIVADRQ